MTREERKQARIERYHYLAENASKESNDLLNKSSRMAEAIPFGQPILIGHHSEQRDRNYRNKIWNTIGKSVKAAEKAEYYEQKAKAAEKRYQALNRKYTDSLKVIEEKDSSLSVRQYIIVTLGIILVILAAVLVLGGLFLARIVVISRRRKKDIDELEDRNRQKTRFIQNITAQMQPALQHLDGHLPAVQAMKSYLEHIEEMSVLENTLSEPYEMKEVNIATFCERVMETVRPLVQPDVALVVNAPKLSVAVNAEHLERLLAHLLVNAARHTPSGGKITLEFKKRSAHSHQINVSDTGDGIPEEKRAQLFVPFTEVKDLMKGDGLGLPVCALIARKMNGQLTLDTGYTKGTRFVLELHV